MKPSIIVCGLLLGALLLPSSIMASRSKKKIPFEWDTVTDSDWQITKDTAKNYTDAVMIFEKITENDKQYENDKCYRTIYRRIRILSDDGRDWGNVQAPYFDDEQKILDIQGRAIQRDGTISLLLPEQIFKKQAVKTKKKKLKQTTFSVPGVTNDCIVEYMIKYHTPDYNAVWVIQKEIPLLHAELRWVLTKWKLNQSFADMLENYITPNYLWLNTYSEVDVKYLPNIKKPETLLFVSNNIPAFEKEPYTVIESSLKTKLICYNGSKEHASSYWDRRANGRQKILDKFCKKDKKVIEVVKQFSDLDSDEEKIKAAGEWIQQNILNLNYFTYYDPKKPTKKKKTKKRRSVDDVIKRGYGTRYQISYLFCDMLREMNIDAKVVFAKSRFDDLFVKQAKYWQFNRALVAVVKQNTKPKFYSPGFPYIPVDETPYYLQGTIALVCGGFETLSPIPFSDASNTTISRLYSYTIDDELEISGTVSERSSGTVAQRLRLAILNEDTVDIKNILTEELEDDFSGVELEVFSYENFDDVSKPVTIKYNIEQPEISETGSKVLLKPGQYLSRSKSPFDTDERKEAIMFSYGYNLRETAQIAIPSDWEIEAVPEDTVFVNEIGKCAISYQSFGNTLTVQRMFKLNFPFWRVDFIEDIRALYQARQNFSESIVVLAESEE